MTSFSDHKLTVMSMLTSIVSLLLVSLVIWVFLSTQEKVQQLQVKLQNMQQTLDDAEELPPEITQLRERIHSLEDKLQTFERKKEVNIVQQPTIKTITPTTEVKILKQTTKVKAMPQPKRHWMVVIASFDSLKKAKKYQNSKKIYELHSTITRVKLKSGTWYRVVRADFSKKASAIAFNQKMKTLGFRDTWIQHRP